MCDRPAPTILLVEDDPGHARLIEKNLRRAGIGGDIFVVTDGEAALDFVLCQGPFEGRNLPSRLLVLLDLNLPASDGFRVLDRIKANPKTRPIPVIVLTSSDDDRDVSRCYELGCNVFITKPLDYKDFSETIRRLSQFLGIAQFSSGA
jgi:CheY-like chemotaxis protein